MAETAVSNGIDAERLKARSTGGIDTFKKGWFTELDNFHPEWNDVGYSIAIKKLLYHKRSAFQDIVVFDSNAFGRVLVLDGIVNCSESDEFVYHEMVTHLPLFAHACPKKVLVIGGGDGGVVREVAKHHMVEEIHLCEIDEEVISVAKEYLPTMAVGLEEPRLQLHIEDGYEFMKRNKDKFDVIITDSPDPIGPAKVLFQKPYFECCKEALKPKGVLCFQGECFWYEEEQKVIADIFKFCRTLFPVTKYANTSVPSYFGETGFILCSIDQDNPLDVPVRKLAPSQVSDLSLRYYNSAVHTAAFVLPNFANKLMQGDC